MSGNPVAIVRGPSAREDARTIGDVMRSLERIMVGIHGHHLILTPDMWLVGSTGFRR